MEEFQTSCETAFLWCPRTLIDGWRKQLTPKINLTPSFSLNAPPHLFPPSLSPSPLVLRATPGYKQGVMRGRGPACRGRWGWLWPRFGDLYCLLSKPRRRLLSHYRRLEPLFIRGLHVKSSGAGHRGHLLRLLLYTLILCLLMGTGSSEPRVPLDNWLLPHLLTSPPLTLLHFTFKVLHFFSPLNLFHLLPSSDSQHLLMYFAFFYPPLYFTSSSVIQWRM